MRPVSCANSNTHSIEQISNQDRDLGGLYTFFRYYSFLDYPWRSVEERRRPLWGPCRCFFRRRRESGRWWLRGIENPPGMATGAIFIRPFFLGKKNQFTFWKTNESKRLMFQIRMRSIEVSKKDCEFAKDSHFKKRFRFRISWTSQNLSNFLRLVQWVYRWHWSGRWRRRHVILFEWRRRQLPRRGGCQVQTEL